MIFHISGINPEPWTAPEVSIGRKGGKVYPAVYKTETLRAYQEAIKDSLSDIEDHVIDDGEPFALHFWFWRQLPDYDLGDGRRSRRHIADATNLQKALEDALQGVLFKNDRWCLDVRSTMVEQGHETVPGIVIELEPIAGNPIPNSKISKERTLIVQESQYNPTEDPRADLDVDDLF